MAPPTTLRLQDILCQHEGKLVSFWVALQLCIGVSLFAALLAEKYTYES
jgi:hypothetical protein